MTNHSRDSVMTLDGDTFTVSHFGDALPGKGQFLVLHGAGKADRRRMFPVCSRLAEAGYAAVTFDFWGHGETTRPLGTTSLETRTRQARHVAASLPPDAPLSILSFSMGGYTAIKLVEETPHRVENLIMYAPAVYDAAAYAVPFGPDFSTIIRQPESWSRSDAFRILESLEGGLMLVWGSNDSVIPRDIIDMLANSAPRARDVNVHIISGGPHTLSGWFNEDPDAADRHVGAAIDFAGTAARIRSS